MSRAKQGFPESENEDFLIMIQRIIRARRGVALLAAVAVVVRLPVRVPADLVPKEQDKVVVRLVCNYLQQGHLNRPKINDDISRRLFQRFFKSLDPYKVYFVKADVEEFKKFETELDDML